MYSQKMMKIISNINCMILYFLHVFSVQGLFFLGRWLIVFHFCSFRPCKYVHATGFSRFFLIIEDKYCINNKFAYL